MEAGARAVAQRLLDQPRMSDRTAITTVLVVDDHLAMAETIADGLADRGFDTIAVASGEAALEVLDQRAVQVIVTDLRMQPVDGFEVLRRAKLQDPARPVIVMTGFGAVHGEVESRQRGADDYVTKPFKVDTLAARIARMLRRSATD